MMTYCTHCGNELNRSVDWIHLGPETEDYICPKCGEMTTIKTRIIAVFYGVAQSGLEILMGVKKCQI